MTEIDAKMVMKLRQETGAPMMDCKKALAETGGDWEKAKESLRLKGLQAAEKRAERSTSEGRVFSYIHAGEKIGVLVQIDCETDFVARNQDFEQFGKDLCLHIAFKRPPYMRREEVPQAEVDKERAFLLTQVQEQMAGKPADIQEKAVDGRMSKFYEERCLLEQPFVKDDKKTIETYRKEMVAKIGENLVLQRFACFEVGA
ncbi:MAG: translation elongation factor Ts [Planctomycetes bacterium]|nr:translation elongation factor Ts [Planctomycetota bacterium]MCB9918854.1 translation elongation factor Ts [Planctomycetota bacterium]